MTFNLDPHNIDQSFFKDLFASCEEAQKSNYPVAQILLNQIECEDGEAALQLFKRGMEDGWWDKPDDLVTLLEIVPKNKETQNVIKEILVYLDTLNLKLDCRQKVALVWCDYAKQYDEHEALFDRMKLLLQSRSFLEGYKAVREQFGWMKTDLTIPFDGDLGIVMKAAMQTNAKATIDRDVFTRMDLRGMELYPPSLLRFNDTITRIKSNDCETWKLASRAFVKGADPAQAELLLGHLKRHGCVDETLDVLIYCLRNKYKFDAAYGYWCAEELFPTDFTACIVLITEMVNSPYYDSQYQPEKQINFYCSFALAAEEETDALGWISKALLYRDQNVWKGLEKQVLLCAELCRNCGRIDHFHSFMTILTKIVGENHRLYERMSALWDTTLLGSDHEVVKARLHNYSRFLKPRICRPDLRERICEVIKTEIEMHPKSPEEGFNLLTLYEITDSEIWMPLLKNILGTKNASWHRKGCKAWVDLLQQESSKYWDIISQMIHQCEVDDLIKVLKIMDEKQLELTIVVISGIIQASQKILQQQKKIDKEKKVELLSSLGLFSGYVIDNQDKKGTEKWLKQIDIPLINCFMTVPTYENLSTCCDILTKNINKLEKYGLFPFETFNQIFHRLVHLNPRDNDELLSKFLVLVIRLQAAHKVSSTLIQTMEILSTLPSEEAKVMAAFYFDSCLGEKFFKQLSQFDKSKLEAIFKRLLSSDTSGIDGMLLTCLRDRQDEICKIFQNEKLPQFVVSYLDRKIKEFDLEESDDPDIWLNNYKCVFGYTKLLFLSPNRQHAFNNFTDFFLNTLSRLESPDQIEQLLSELCAIFNKKSYSNSAQKTLIDICRYTLILSLITELSVIKQNTLYYETLYKFIYDSLENIPINIAQANVESRLQDSSIILFQKFSNCWPNSNKLFIVHCGKILKIADAIIEKDHKKSSRNLCQSVINNIASTLEAKFNTYTSDELLKLMNLIIGALDCLKKTMSEEKYQKFIHKNLDKLLVTQKKQNINYKFVDYLFVLACRINSDKPVLTNLLMYTMLEIKNELKKTKPDLECCYSTLAVGAQRFFKHILDKNIQDQEPKKYAYIFKEYISVIEILSKKYLNSDLKPVIELLEKILKTKSTSE